MPEPLSTAAPALVATRGRAWVALVAMAILLWSALASLVAAMAAQASGSGGGRPVLDAGVCLCLGSLMTLPRWRTWLVRWQTFAIGAGGFISYHLLLFAALHATANAFAVNLVNYLWPLLIVVLSPLVIRARLRAHHILAALLGFAGTALVVSGGLHFDAHELGAYAMAAIAALIWALYSLLSSVQPPYPSSAVGGFCLSAGLCALAIETALHGASATWHAVESFTPTRWMLLVATGLGPMGAAFLCWDAALKRGDQRIIGACAYATPLLSSLWLVLLFKHPVGWNFAGALALIVCGSALAGLGSGRAAARA